SEAADGIRDLHVTGVQTCALPIYYFQADANQEVVSALEMGIEQFPDRDELVSNLADAYQRAGQPKKAIATVKKMVEQDPQNPQRSEERRVGKEEGRCGGAEPVRGA